jgi:hypothetical protein
MRKLAGGETTGFRTGPNTPDSAGGAEHMLNMSQNQNETREKKEKSRSKTNLENASPDRRIVIILSFVLVHPSIAAYTMPVSITIFCPRATPARPKPSA